MRPLIHIIVVSIWSFLCYMAVNPDLGQQSHDNHIDQLSYYRIGCPTAGYESQTIFSFRGSYADEEQRQMEGCAPSTFPLICLNLFTTPAFLRPAVSQSQKVGIEQKTQIRFEDHYS
jgi:hypothetical protein